jgi:CDP-6-deoxy-D-xylo-4-hexulose-3-dehydrase
MEFDNLLKIKGHVGSLLESGRRINDAKHGRYWYPLSLPTYNADEIVEAIDSMCSFHTSMGEKTLRFERQFTEWQGSTDSIMVNSGSSADLLLSMLLTNPLRPLLPPGSEVIVPVVTWPTQIWAAKMAGLKVNLVDVDPETLNLDLDDLERCISKDTRGVFLVHLMGNPCDMDRITAICQAKGLYILEDCCEAMGASWDGKRVGNFGIGAAFSFFFSHHITTMEGGMIAVSDRDHAEQIRLLRAHGWTRNVESNKHNLKDYPEIDPRYTFINWGLNVRPTEVQAGFGLHQLNKIETFAHRREQIANTFNSFISKTPWLQTPRVEPKAKPSWLALPIMVAEDAPFSRSELTTYLEAQGVETRPIVTGNIAKQPVAKIFPEFLSRTFPGADQVHTRGFYIGLSPMQTDAIVNRLIETFESFLANH